VFLDATYLHVRRTGRVTSMAVVIATGVTATGGREILGVDVGDLETPPPSGAQSAWQPHAARNLPIQGLLLQGFLRVPVVEKPHEIPIRHCGHEELFFRFVGSRMSQN
jgi:hypothetical protein